MSDTVWRGSTPITNLMMEIEDPLPTGASTSDIIMNIDYWGIGHRGYESRFTSSDAYFWNDLTEFEGNVNVSGVVTVDSIVLSSATTKTLNNTYIRRQAGNGWSHDSSNLGYVALLKDQWVLNHFIVPDDYIEGTQILLDHYFLPPWDAGTPVGTYNVKFRFKTILEKVSEDTFGTENYSWNNEEMETEYDDYPVRKQTHMRHSGVLVTDSDGEVNGKVVEPGDSVFVYVYVESATTNDYFATHSQSFKHKRQLIKYQAAVELGE